MAFIITAEPKDAGTLIKHSLEFKNTELGEVISLWDSESKDPVLNNIIDALGRFQSMALKSSSKTEDNLVTYMNSGPGDIPLVEYCNAVMKFIRTCNIPFAVYVEKGMSADGIMICYTKSPTAEISDPDQNFYNDILSNMNIPEETDLFIEKFPDNYEASKLANSWISRIKYEFVNLSLGATSLANIYSEIGITLSLSKEINDIAADLTINWLKLCGFKDAYFYEDVDRSQFIFYAGR